MSGRLPPPWTITIHEESIEVRDANGTALAYLYFHVGPPRVGTGRERLTRDQARRVALNIAKLPALLRPVSPPPTPGET